MLANSNFEHYCLLDVTDPEEGRSFFQNGGKYLLVYIASHSRMTVIFIVTAIRKHQISWQ
jgi:hypothetical protein